MTPLRGAIVGFGLIAERAHVDALREAGLEVAAVVEVAAERRAAAARLLPGARTYASVAELLAAERLDFVDVCTPPHLHVEVAEQATRAGLHTLVEKPIAIHLADAERLARLCQEHGTVLACVNNWTQAPILARVQDLCRTGALGRLRSLEISVERTQPAAAAGEDNWRIDRARAGGGILFDHGWHGMSILGRALAAEPVRVRCSLAKRRHGDLEVEDTAEVDVDYADGSRGRFTATWAADVRRNRVTAIGERGSIEVENDVLRLTRDGDAREERFAESLADGGYRPSWTAGIVREFVAEIAAPGGPRRAAGEALTCMRLLDAAYEADARGGSVEL